MAITDETIKTADMTGWTIDYLAMLIDGLREDAAHQVLANIRRMPAAMQRGLSPDARRA